MRRTLLLSQLTLPVPLMEDKLMFNSDSCNSSNQFLKLNKYLLRTMVIFN